jgi:dienelactone hydrolase
MDMPRSADCPTLSSLQKSLEDYAMQTAARVALLLVAWACLAVDPATSQQSKVGTRIEFDSQARGHKERVWGYLSFPSTPQERYPMMLIMHASGGIHARDWFFARTLNQMGIATFVLDSFGPRGLTKVSENKRSFGDREQAIDALSAFETVRKDARIDMSRLGAMGRSLGGQTAIRLSLKASRDRLGMGGPILSVALALTPGCTSQERDGELTKKTAVWFFLAERDFSPYRRCIAYVEKMVASGGDAHFKVYPDAFHTFDGSARPVWTPNQEVYAKCANDRIRSDYSIRLDTGAALRTRKDWDSFFSSCITRGSWQGGNPEATLQLDQDWTRVVKERLLSN